MVGEIPVVLLHGLLPGLILLLADVLHFLGTERVAAQNIAHAFAGGDFWHGIRE
jgi:hypothetical protein